MLSRFFKWIVRGIINGVLKTRWAYFHVHPGYTKFYMDSDRSEAHFFHAKTNSIHSKITLA